MDERDPKLADRLLRAMLTHDRDHAVILLDPGGRVVGWHAGASQIFGYTAGEMCGQRLDRLFVPEDRALGIPEQELVVARAASTSEDDRWQQRKDGSRFWAHGAVTLLPGPDGQVAGFAKVLRDRTDVRGQIERLENRVRELEDREASRNVFLATLAHELRAPLAPLVNALALVRRLAESQPDLAPPSEIMERQIELMRRLVSDLNDVIRIGAGKAELQLERLDLRRAAREALESCAAAIEERHQRAELLTPAAPICCRVDPVRIHQVLVNLVTNASKYTDPGGRIWVTVSAEGHDAVVRVLDTGIGIAAELQPRVFDLFTQAVAAPAMQQGGFGLGLALVKELAELHGGSVQVRSEGAGKGSEFTVRLPLDPAGPTA